MLSPAVVAALAPRVQGRDPESTVFQTKTGLWLHHGNFTDRVLKPAVAAAALLGQVPAGTRVHGLRHSHAAWLASAGCNLLQIKDRVGHASVLTTDKVYGHLCAAAGQTVLRATDLGLAGLVGTPENMQAIAAGTDPSIARLTGPDGDLPEVEIPDSEDLAA